MRLSRLAHAAARRAALAVLLAGTLAGCASLTGQDPPVVEVAGIDPLQGEGLELRMAVKLRVQNPNDDAISYNGAALEIYLNGSRFASGVTDESGTVPRYGETVLTVPVSVPALTALRQALGLAKGDSMTDIPYILKGKLSGGMFGSVRFEGRGSLSLPRY